MRTRLLFFLGFQFIFLAALFAQEDSISTISFTYDASGNRTSREIIYYQGGLKSAKIIKEEEKVPEFEKGLNVYPNPASNCLYVTLNDEALELDYRVIILYNSLGIQILKMNATMDVNKVDVSNLPYGTYILKLIYGSKHKEWVIIKN